ncbi:hypothetical protein OPKNFCMD_6861 [Methylobacterium crusticola]|uniref:Uncharacterized protein n=1 Tax=Methylobacterium crusticola TaxID=1697972 RepID=A0ABQ4RA68_9HYPH|nr:hypothetical protein [Methylobacterium crusticola]GJD54080.1 hypothetical protein OPKNFCMD_6861 [Methylobacterium crusticola]
MALSRPTLVLTAFLVAGVDRARATDLPLAINVDPAANDRTGDPLRTAFQKTMSAVNALYYQRAQANGLATLGADGRLPSSQIPAGAAFSQSISVGAGAENAIDLITSAPTNGTWITHGSLKAEPILGPFNGVAQDLTRAGLARWYTASGNSDTGEYANLFNMHVTGGYPTAWQGRSAYRARSTVINGGRMYVVKPGTRGGTSAASGGPTGTTPGVDIADGSVIWRYEPNMQAANGGKTNFALMTYADTNASATWGAAIDTQISNGTNRINVNSVEIDLNNYRLDYGARAPGGSANALQIFMGGPRRSSAALAISAYDTPSDAANSVNGITLCCDRLVSDNSILDLTHAQTGIRLGGVYSGYQITGTGWNVNPVGVLTAAGAVMTAGFRLAPFTVSTLYACVPASVGTMAYVTDATSPAYDAVVTTGGGTKLSPVFCDGTAWRYR